MLADEFNEERLLLGPYEDVEYLIGQIVMNRITGIAFDNFDLERGPKEAIKFLKQSYISNIKANDSYIDSLAYLSTILMDVDIPYALLKGAYLIPFVYKKGHRTSNDVDIMIASKNVTSLQTILLDNGFLQGSLSYDGSFKPASRREIVQSKMNYGETIPFFKNHSDHWIELDINFSLDYKPTQLESVISEMLSNTIEVEKDDLRFRTLNGIDFMIHLCCHLYKEATTFDWVATKRDMMLYKFSDINVLFMKKGSFDYCSQLAERIVRYGLEKECFYAFENASLIFPRLNSIDGFVKLKHTIKPQKLNFMRQIIHPSERKVYQFDLDFTNWFFCKNRIECLKETNYEVN